VVIVVAIRSQEKSFQGLDTGSTGLELLRRSLSEAVEWLLIFGGLRRTVEQVSRNELLRLRFAAGEALSDLARAFGISPQRAYQIVHFKRR
jgi:hypothetical protein